MNITITPTPLHGIIRPPASKSQAHRLIIAAALAEGESLISHVDVSQDISATLRAMKALGAEYVWTDDHSLRIRGVPGFHRCSEPLDCGESGSTLRFLIPVALAVAGGATFRGRGRLMERPQEPYFNIFQEKSILWDKAGDTLTVSGTLTPGLYILPGDISSQFVTGLLYALPLLEGDSFIRLSSPLQSSGYVDMTLAVLRHFGVAVKITSEGWFVPGNQKYQPIDSSVEADFSQSGFFFAMAGMGSDLKITGLSGDSAQGDKIVVPYMEKLNGAGEVTLDVRECPDLVPPLAARAALRPGQITRIVGAERLRIKESDRLKAVTAVLGAMGADIIEHPDALTIRGKETLPGGVTVDSWNDHRIAMMAAAAATKCLSPVTVLGAECVGKSYPRFWEDYEALGGMISEVTA